ncbi:hypothetical protein I204_02363 [Kwoniella mangroviensis CBS 8886]|uniref:hypothetical protein n=1 Tax=Kwoniella mangroviensis CBS 8507 TaxID=1296122 RepID=UPI00080CDD94|nr:uncharacterized protein I203_02267 [Kwoniella mangroviensis CBS 8507]OCF68875.1 hypothetical protein I203_02267 [Kwoniella mangroviensis CBS 8507]OCF76663.1 hypothetical protein I204_02363 [Kwoniella mangroviensis CBS 8886]
MSDSEDVLKAPEGGATLREVLIEDSSSLSSRSTSVELKATTAASDPPIDQRSVRNSSAPGSQERSNTKWNVQAAAFRPSTSLSCDTDTEAHHTGSASFGTVPHISEGTSNTTIYDNRAEKQWKVIYGHSPAYNADQPSYRGDTREASHQDMMWTNPYSDDPASAQGLTENLYPLGYHMPPNNDHRFQSYASSFQDSTGGEGPTGIVRSSGSIGDYQRLEQKYTKNDDPETFQKEEKVVPSFPGKVDESFPSLDGTSAKTSTNTPPPPISSSGSNTNSWANIAASPRDSNKASLKSEEESIDDRKIPSATSVRRYTGGSWAKVAAGTQERK